MALRSSIEWTQSTWNPVTGCSKVSAGCRNCYAQRMALRLQAMGQPNYANGFAVTLHERSLDLPLSWKSPQMVFVNSMGDLFHEEVPTDFILRAFQVMASANWHVFQVLTKRSERLLSLDSQLPWMPHIWMGVSVEDKTCMPRADCLRQTQARVKFLSLEPLLGPLTALNLQGIDWVIVGGESGPGARPIDPRWVLGLRNMCQGRGVPFFFKQWGGRFRKKAGRQLEGRTWDEMPTGRTIVRKAPA